MTDRYGEYRRVARKAGVDAVALVPGSNFERLFKKSFHSNERPLVVVIPQAGDPVAVVPNLELRSFDLIGFEGEVFDWRDQNGYVEAFTALGRAMPIRSLAVEGQIMRVFISQALQNAIPGLSIVDAEMEIAALRLRKSVNDIAAMEKAIEISEVALTETLEAVKPGMTEKQVESLLLEAQFRNGAEGLAFGPIVAAAENSARPHASARADYAIQAGDALLLDFGAKVGGFCADITRTVFVGHATDEAAEVYEVVRNANETGHQVTASGVTAHQVDDAVIGVLEASAFADRIRTKTGHGLGRDVHEAPYIMRGNHEVLEEGMVFTIEPGLYDIGSFGVRIEDDVVVTADGCRSLTTFSRELTVI
jgi:Xaa-Pro dipeptidase